MRISMIGQPYQLAPDLSTLRWEESPADSREGRGIRYHVDLRGVADRNWRKTFYLVQWDHLGNFNFHLRDDGRAISFHRKPEEGPERAELLLGALEVLVKIVN